MTMIHQYPTEGRKTRTILFVLIKVIIFGKLTECSTPHEALLPEDTDNSHFDSFEGPYSDESYNIKTPACIIPAISFQNLLVKKSRESKKRIPFCNNYNTRLLESNQTHIWIIKSNYKHYKIKNASNLVCCYQSFHGPLSSPNLPRNVLYNTVHYHDCLNFDDIIEVDDEFVRVTCYYGNRIVYEQFYIFAPKMPFTLVRDDPLKTDSNQTQYNVMIMGLGSITRENIHRTMHETVRLLKKYDVVELKGYSTLAGDTFHNMIAALAGMNDLELKAICLTNENSTLDRCPFIWERFKDFGYYTALMEDTARFSMFNQGKYGFRGSPTDYYTHPFIHQSEILERRQNRNSKSNCMGDRYVFEVLLNYIQDITTTLKKNKLFGVFWDKSINNNLKNVPRNLDNSYVRLLKTMETTGYLNDTILILMSDHGMDFADIRLKDPIERRQPFLFMLMPPSFRKRFRLAYQNLKMNVGRLTTSFDVHKTLLDLVEMSVLFKKNILKRSTEFYTHNRGISLFLEIPINRTCEMAGISKEWCACYDAEILPTTKSSELSDAVEFINFQTNEVILKPYPECSRLKVEEIITAKKLVPVYDRRTKWNIYNVIVRMNPGGGIFEVIFRYYDKTTTIIDNMQRLNSLDIRSACAENELIKSFCYCK